jgi:hypothetical protein
MKSNLYFLILLLCPLVVFAQHHDNNVVMGESLNPNSNPYGLIMSFDAGYPKFEVENTRHSFSLYGITCSDSIGDLLFHTNGRTLRNRQHELIENGDSLNPGFIYNEYPLGYPSTTSGLALPSPKGQHLYYLIHTSFNNQLVVPYFPVVYYSLIDMAANNGKGKVLLKNQVLCTGDVPNPVAIKHGNGRDWWLIVGNNLSKVYHTYLIDPTGIHLAFDQTDTPQALGWSPSYHGVSPDGNYYINNDTETGLWIYNFDRCTGRLSAPRNLPYDPAIPIYLDNSSGFYSIHVDFSQDSRFAYLSTHLVVYQMDMQSIDEGELKVDTVGRYEYGSVFADYPVPISNSFTGADGKIYYSGYIYTPIFHTITRPELPLLASKFTQKAITTPYPKYDTRYIFPAYRLGRALGAVCDTLPFAGPVEERFRHMPLGTEERNSTAEPESVRRLYLPEKFRQAAPQGPYRPVQDPLSPVNMARQALQRRQTIEIIETHEK